MKRTLILFTFAFPIFSFSQTSNSALIIGDGIRIRSEPSVKGKEVSKVYGFREVQLVDTGNKKDDLGSKDPCELYPWHKVKWAGDSTGWVYGKYYFETYSTPVNFTLGSKTYSGLSYVNKEQPEWGNDEGAFGCSGVTTYVVFYSAEKKKYYTVKDGISKSTKYLDIDQYAGADIEKIEINNNDITLLARYSTQEQDGFLVYTIAFANGQFYVTSYK